MAATRLHNYVFTVVILFYFYFIDGVDQVPTEAYLYQCTRSLINLAIKAQRSKLVQTR